MPDTTSKIAFTEEGTRFRSEGITFVIGPYEDYALSWAVDFKAARGNVEIDALNVGTSETESMLRKALAIGADRAFRIDTPASDAHVIADQIAAFAKDKHYDLILMGRESIETNRAQVHFLVGQRLGIEVVCPVMSLAVSEDSKTATMKLEIEGGFAKAEAQLPLILGCQEPIAEWKIPNMRGIMTARTKPLEVIQPVESTSKVLRKKYETPTPRASAKMIDAGQPEELIRLLKEEAKVL